MTATTETNSTSASPSSHVDALQEGRYLVLVEFAHRHLDFLMSELQSVLELNGLLLSADPNNVDGNSNSSSNEDNNDDVECRLEALPHQQEFDALVEERSQIDGFQKMARRPFCLLSFSRQSKWAPKPTQQPTQPSQQQQQQQQPPLSLQPPQQCIGQVLLDRCVLVRSVVELWGMGRTISQCAQAVQRFIGDDDADHSKYQQRQQRPDLCPHGPTIYQHHCHSDRSWKVSIRTLGATFTRDEQSTQRQHFDFLEFQGPVQMKAPTDEYVLIREVELDYQGGAFYPRHDCRKRLLTENNSRPPLCCYFGRNLVGNNDHTRTRGKLLHEYSLKQRKYLGPTSMDTELSLVMTNLAQVQKGDMVLDPFVGTGSILIACALRGAHCVGTDIDIRVLRGKGEGETVFANFDQYGLPRPELVRSDNARYTSHFRAETPLYDAIVCDPPYGIRAGARQSGSRKQAKLKELTEDERKDHIPQTKPYAVSDVMADLLDMAAQSLVIGGRLVYIIPSYSDFDAESDLPRHPCLRLAHICYQPLSLELGRRLVAMQKVTAYDASQKESVYQPFCWKNGPESADKCANLREKIIEAAKLKPDYAEKYRIRKQKRQQHKAAKKKAKLEQQQQKEET